MLEDNIRNIIGSRSFKQLEGFPTEEIEALLRKTPTITRDFFTPLQDMDFQLEKDGHYLSITLGALLNNRLVPNSKMFQKVRNYFQERSPSDYKGFADNLDDATRDVLRDAIPAFRGEVQVSHSVIGMISETDSGTIDGLIRKRTPVLLVAHETLPVIGSSDFSKFHETAMWEPFPEEKYADALNRMKCTGGVGYLS